LCGHAPRGRSWFTLFIALAPLAIAAALLQFDRANGPGQQRVTVRWATGLSAEGRQAAERTHGLVNGEETEPGTFSYALDMPSRAAIRRLVGDPRAVDTAHIDRERFRILVDAPALPRAVRLALEARLLPWLSGALMLVGLLTTWRVRGLLQATVATVAQGPAHLPRAAASDGPSWSAPVLASAVRALLRVQEDWDWWAWRLYRPLVGAVLAAMTAFTAWHGEKLASEWDPWTIGDWLITYAGGFVRRGLGGELVLAASRATGSPPNQVAWATFVLLYASFAAGLFTVLWQRRLTFWYLVLCLSPACLTFTFHNPEAVGRKDVLLLASLTLWAFLQRSRPASTASTSWMAVLAVLLTLLHEVFAFFTPYFVLLAYLAEPEPRRGHWRRALLVPGAAGLVVPLIAAFSGPLSEPALCQRLVATGAPPQVCEGVLDYGRESVAASVSLFQEAATLSAVPGIGAALALTLVPPLVFLLATVRTRRSAMFSGAVVALAVLATTPLFVLAIDWGRWLALHAGLLTIVASVVLPAGGGRPYRPAHGTRLVVSLALGLTVVASMFLWEVRHCCQADLIRPFSPLVAARAVLDDLGF